MRLLWLWLLFALSQCASEGKQLLLSSEVISLRKSDLSEKGFSRGEFVTIKRCADDRPPKDQGEKIKTWGSLDFLLDKAHNSTKSDYFLKATIYSEGGCLTLRAYTGALVQ